LVRADHHRFAARLAAAERAYAAVRLVSVDVALAALGGGVMAARVVGASPRPVFYGLLPASVWVVYTLDHLIDARRMGDTAATPRHRFHGRHAIALWAVLVPSAVVCGVVGLVALSWFGVAFGLGMVVLVGLHELIVKLAGSRASPLLVKELGVGVIFTAGTWGLPAIVRWVHVGAPAWQAGVLAVQYALLAGVNLVEFSLFEARRDAAAGQTSFVRGVGRAAAARVVVAMLLAQLPLATVMLAFGVGRTEAVAELVLLAMAAGLWAILRFPRTFVRRERYRTLGDGVFLLPLLMAALS
jgi:hypothetical protein